MIICSPSAFQTSTNEKKRNFVETVEAHVTLGVDPRRGDQVCMLLSALFYLILLILFCSLQDRTLSVTFYNLVLLSINEMKLQHYKMYF